MRRPALCARFRAVPVLLAALVLAACGGSGGGGGGSTPPPPPPGADVAAAIFHGVNAIATAGGAAVRLDWNEAVDDATDSSAIVYRVYASATSGGQNFASPVATTGAGETSIVLDAADTPLIAVGAQVFFVVRAVDASGNVDGNVTELTVTIAPSASVAFVSDTAGGAGTLGDPADPFPTIQAGVLAVEGNGGGVVLVDAASGGTTYTEEVDFTASVPSISLFGSFERFSALPAGPSGAAILATRDLDDRRTRIEEAAPVAGDLVRITNSLSRTYIDGFDFQVPGVATPLTGLLTFTPGSTQVQGLGTLFTSEVSGDDIVQLDADAIPVPVGFVNNDTELFLAQAYPGTGGTGPGSVIGPAGIAVQGIDAWLQLSGSTLVVRNGVVIDTTGIAVQSRTRLVGNVANGPGEDAFRISGGSLHVRVQNNRVFEFGQALSSEGTTGFLHVSAAGLVMTLTDNYLDDNRSMSPGDFLDMSFAPANPGVGGDLSVLAARNEIRNHLGNGIDMDRIADVGANGSAHVIVRDNTISGTSTQAIEIQGLNDTPHAGVDLTVEVFDNLLVNGNGRAVQVSLPVSADRTSRIEVRDNFMAITESHLVEIDSETTGTADASDGGVYLVDIFRNLHFGGGEDIDVQLGVAHGGRSVLSVWENTVLTTEEPALTLEPREYVAPTTGFFAFPDGVFVLRVFNNDLTGSDDEAMELRDGREADDSICVAYIGHNYAQNGSDGTDGAIEVMANARQGAWLVERNFTGAGGQDSGEVGIEIESSTDDVGNLVRIQNNVATLGSGSGINFDAFGSSPQIVNNTVSYNGQNGEYGIENDSGSEDGHAQAFILNCIVSHNGGDDLERTEGVRAYWSLIRDETDPPEIGSIGGEPFFAKDLLDLREFALTHDAVKDLFTLLSTSPAVDAGHPASRYDDPNGTRNDMGAYGGPGAGPIATVGAGATIPLVYVGIFPSVDLFTGSTLVDATETIHFGFSAPVSQASIAGNLRVRSGGADVPGTFTVTHGGYIVAFDPTTTLTVGANTFVDVTMGTGLLGTTGAALAYPVEFRFAVRPAAATPESEPNDDLVPGVSPADLAAGMNVGGPASTVFEIAGLLAAPADVDVYTFTADAGDRISATILDSRVGNGNDGAMRIDLYDASGALLNPGRRNQFNPDGTSNGDPFLDHLLPAGGTYHLVVTNPDATAPHPYTLLGVLD